MAGQPGHIFTAARGILPRPPDIQEHHGLGDEGQTTVLVGLAGESWWRSSC